jgi:hypothetical protein
MFLFPRCHFHCLQRKYSQEYQAVKKTQFFTTELTQYPCVCVCVCVVSRTVALTARRLLPRLWAADDSVVKTKRIKKYSNLHKVTACQGLNVFYVRCWFWNISQHWWSEFSRFRPAVHLHSSFGKGKDRRRIGYEGPQAQYSSTLSLTSALNGEVGG